MASNVVQPMIEPDSNAIKTHLETLFAPCRGEYSDGLIELRHGEHFKSAYFTTTPARIADAVAWAVDRNRSGENVYVGVNPRRPSTRGPAEDRDVQIAFWHFADMDDAEAVDQAGRRLKALPPTFTVNTGTEPHRRPHFYWRLEEPVGNMDAWRERQRGIAQSLDGDPVVINPSRIMRLAGTVNFPPQRKLAKGYRVELTSLRTTFPDERAPVSADEIATAYPVRAGEMSAYSSPQGQNTLQAMAAGNGVDVASCLANCRADNRWREHARSLTAHWVSIGWSTVEILAMADHITVAGYHVEDTRKDLRKLADDARKKWNIAEPDAVAIADPDAAPKVFETLSLDEIENLPPPTYLIEDLVPEHGLTFVYGDPGAGKSFIVLDAALRLAYGMDWHGVPTIRTGVLYIAGEGKHGLGKRVKGWRREHAPEGADAPFKLLPVAVHMLDKESVQTLKNTIEAVATEVNFKIGLVVIDTVSRAIPGHDENKQDTMSLFVDGCAALHNFIDGALIGVHHSGKDSDKGMRGSSVLLGACEASVKVTKAGDIVTLLNEKQKDEEESGPIYMTMKKVEWAQGLDKPQRTLVPFRTDAQPEQQLETMSRETVYEILKVIDGQWQAGTPLSPYPQAKRTGCFAPAVIGRKFKLSAKLISDYLEDWQMNGIISYEQIDSHTKAKGFRVLDWIMP